MGKRLVSRGTHEDLDVEYGLEGGTRKKMPACCRAGKSHLEMNCAVEWRPFSMRRPDGPWLYGNPASLQR